GGPPADRPADRTDDREVPGRPSVAWFVHGPEPALREGQRGTRPPMPVPGSGSAPLLLLDEPCSSVAARGTVTTRATRCSTASRAGAGRGSPSPTACAGAARPSSRATWAWG